MIYIQHFDTTFSYWFIIYFSMCWPTLKTQWENDMCAVSKCYQTNNILLSIKKSCFIAKPILDMGLISKHKEIYKYLPNTVFGSISTWFSIIQYQSKTLTFQFTKRLTHWGIKWLILVSNCKTRFFLVDNVNC